jgi:hypothetical protein
MNDDDRGLRQLFAQLRHEDWAGVSPFRAPALGEASRRRQSLRLLLAAAAIVLIALLLARPQRNPWNTPSHVVDLGAAAWRSPTDFLLTTPGRELLRTVPALGSPDQWRVTDVRHRSPAPESTRS